MSDAEGSVCVVNLGPRQTRLRRVGAALLLPLSIVLGAWAVRAGWGPVARLGALALFGVGVLSLLQARAQT